MMESKVLLEGGMPAALAWAMDAAAHALEEGKIYEVRYNQTDGQPSTVSWHQCPDDAEVTGAVAPSVPAGENYKFLGRFRAT